MKLLMSILKRQVSSSSVFVSFFTVMKHNFSVNLKLMHFLLWTKGCFFLSGFSFTDTDNSQDSRGREGTIFYSTLPLPSHQSFNFDTFEYSGEYLPNSSCHFRSNKSVFLQILHHSAISWEITPLYFLSSNNICKRSPLKWKFLRLSSAQVKICQIPFANFETTSQFLSKFCIPL